MYFTHTGKAAYSIPAYSPARGSGGAPHDFAPIGIFPALRLSQPRLRWRPVLMLAAQHHSCTNDHLAAETRTQPALIALLKWSLCLSSCPEKKVPRGQC